MWLEDIFSMPIAQHWGYLVLFLVTFVEAMPFGIFIPGHTAIIIAGFLAREGVFKLGNVIIVATIGAMCGDCLGYYLGKKYGYPFIRRHGSKFFLRKDRFEKIRKIVASNSAKAVIIGRYAPGTRSFVPFIGGASKIKFGRFILYDFIGCISWTLTAVLIGFVFGHGYEAASKYINRIILIVFLALVLIIILRSEYKRTKPGPKTKNY